MTKKADRYFTTLIIVLILLLALDVFLFPITKTNGNSMYPTLHNNEFIVCESSKFAKIKRGKIAIIDSKAAGMLIIKRIIAVGGDTVKFNDEEIYVNGELLKEDYVNTEICVGYGYDEFVVPEGYIYVLGDNRGQSWDSRMYGFIPTSEVKSLVLIHFR